MYVLASIFSGSGLISTSNRSCTALRTAESSCDETKVMASPLVPKRPARPTYAEIKRSVKVVSGTPEVHTGKRRDNQCSKTDNKENKTAVQQETLRIDLMPHSVKVGVRSVTVLALPLRFVVRLRHIVVDDNVNTLDVNAPSDKICRDQNAVLALLEILVHLQATHASHTINRRPPSSHTRTVKNVQINIKTSPSVNRSYNVQSNTSARQDTGGSNHTDVNKVHNPISFKLRYGRHLHSTQRVQDLYRSSWHWEACRTLIRSSWSMPP